MKIQFIHPNELDEQIDHNHALLVDVRPREEYRKWHLSNAINLPLSESAQWLRRPYRRSFIIFYCQFGGASLQACLLAKRQGWNVATLSGGFEHYFGKYRPT